MASSFTLSTKLGDEGDFDSLLSFSNENKRLEKLGLLVLSFSGADVNGSGVEVNHAARRPGIPRAGTGGGVSGILDTTSPALYDGFRCSSNGTDLVSWSLSCRLPVLFRRL